MKSLADAVKEHGGIRAAGRALGMAESTIRYRLKQEERARFGSFSLPPAQRYDSFKDATRYFLITSAQDSTAIHKDFWAALNVYAEWLGNTTILVGGYTYNKKLFEDHATISDKVTWPDEIMNSLILDRVEIGDSLVFCGEMNTLPTAVTPLSGLEVHSRDRDGIFPHAKVQLVSIPTQKNRKTKILMTTGSITLPNYIRKKAGLKADIHHVVGAIIVELKPDGTTHYRHIQATNRRNGSFYDLDRCITSGGVSVGNRVEALSYGDIHREKLDPVVAKTTWGFDTSTGRNIDYGMPQPLVDFLRPKFQFFHDLADFSARNHHNIKDHHHRFSTFIKKDESIKNQMQMSADFLICTQRPGTKSVIVQSNHDNALVTWLKTVGESVKFDPVNYEFYLETELDYVKGLKAGIANPPVFARTLCNMGVPDDVHFNVEDEDFIICGDIEMGMHGHLGANGARGSAISFSKMGNKSVTGHTHSAAIRDGAFVNGVSGKLDLGYNKGLSSWSHAHTVVYPNGKRALLFLTNGAWYA